MMILFLRAKSCHKPIEPLIYNAQLNTRPGCTQIYMDIPALANVSFNAFVSILKKAETF